MTRRSETRGPRWPLLLTALLLLAACAPAAADAPDPAALLPGPAASASAAQVGGAPLAQAVPLDAPPYDSQRELGAEPASPPVLDAATVDGCIPPPSVPAGASPEERRRAFREPLPPAPVWNPPGPKRVGLQAGHWLVEQTPAELRGLQAGTSGGGRQEWEVNLDIARRTKSLLEAAGVEVDLLPTTVPMRYRAHAFVSIHADGDTTGRLRGFKIARPGFSSIPDHDDRLVEALYETYGPATGLPRDDEHISLRMRYYYAFNSRRYCHAVAPGVPQAIVETGFLTNAADRQLLLGNPEAAARGIAAGILNFLNERPAR